AGCPSLSSNVTAEPGNWEKAANAAWTSQGQPKVFFYGSIACPYCSASSWAIVFALQHFGVLTGTSYGYSNVNDNPSHIPETILAGSALQSSYVSWDVAESTNDNQITTPGVAGCTEQAFVSTYDNGGSIPFFVIGGTYIHTGSFVDPTQLAGMTTAQVQGQVSNQSGTAWNAISTPAWTLEAFLVKADGGVPTSVANDPHVAPILAQIH
ncbi:MAG TPA: DUF929 family protein, partial [Thermoplasmata archaeon]|nr:DUF929 family protein [Thermoplasmata archaeon]